ncbi:Cht7 [Aphelenchoides bicaudatus]|nr:Cht7 [Aphelenchoides bicaudatus]
MMFLAICLFSAIYAVSAQNGTVRGCYLANWAQHLKGAGKFNIAQNYIPGICTHIFYAFASVDDTFNLKPTDNLDLDPNAGYAQLKLLKQNDSQLKTLISVGGGGFKGKIFAQIASDPKNLQTFAQNTVNYMQQYGFDGVDLDWEFPKASQKDAFSAILKALKNATNGQYLVTAAVSAYIPQIKKSYDLAAVEAALDYMNVMAYDYHGNWEKRTGVNAPLYSKDKLNINRSIQYLLKQGFNASKMVLGMPTYARGWTLKSGRSGQGIGAKAKGPSPKGPITKTKGELAYFEICKLIKKGGKKKWNKKTKTPYVQYKNKWYTYENPKSITQKVKYAQQNKLAGVFVWTIDNDDFKGSCPQKKRYPLMNAISKTLIGQTFE